MKKSVGPVPGVRVLTALAVALVVAVISTCDVFAPPFVFDNPYDPQQEIGYIESFGHPLYENVGGLARPDRIAVVHGEFVAAVRPDPARIKRYFFGDERYEITSFYYDDGHGDHAHDVCIGPDGAIYVAQWRGIHRIDPSGSVQRFWFERDEHEFLRLAPDPDNGIWALTVQRLPGGDERLRIFHLSPERNVVWFDRSYNQMTNRHFWDWDIAVSGNLIALSRRDDVLYIDRLSEEIGQRVVHDGSDRYELVDDGPDYGNMNVQSIAYNTFTGRFFAVGDWRTPNFYRVGYLDGGSGEFIEAIGDDFELSGYDWRGVAVSDGHEYISEQFTGRVVRTDGWQTVHENVNSDPLGFIRVNALSFDTVNPDLMYIADEEHGAIHRYDTSTRDFNGFFGVRGHAHGEIGRPRSMFVTANVIYISRHGNLARHSLSGDLIGDYLWLGYDLDSFVVSGGHLFGAFPFMNGSGVLVYDFAADELLVVDESFVSDGSLKLGRMGDEIVGVRHNRQTGRVTIGTFDQQTFSFSPTGDFPDDALRRRQHGYVYMTDIAVTPFGFIWVTAHDRAAVRVDTTGNVHRTLVFDRRDNLSSVTSGPDGRTYFGFEHGVEVYGAR